MRDASLAIDFGTTFSAMARLDPETGRARVVRNLEGEEKTPSVVYFGDQGTLVGLHALEMLEDESEAGRVFTQPKRRLGSRFAFTLPDGRQVSAVDATAEILKKLKKDAEEGDIGSAVRGAVITCPATFGPLERDALKEAARRAGFEDVQVLEEPVAAGIACLRDLGQRLGRVVLIYDLGGGTFDAAVLLRDRDEHRLLMEPRGIANCGGEDFDRAIYDWFENAVIGETGGALDDGGLNPSVLRVCRKGKEQLSAQATTTLRALVSGRSRARPLGRETFETLIAERVSSTVRLSSDLANAARHRGHPIESVVLIGGSSRIPLVQRDISAALGVAPLRTGAADFAVVLGAAYFGTAGGRDKETSTKDTELETRLLEGLDRELKRMSAPREQRLLDGIEAELGRMRRSR